ncbi:MAG: dinitrogenase iron-molybdenum cofactor biosynthesis protein [Armatimonadetes bacterium CG_4_10_14_3_um_filter_66_18]|nr:dinitrogenase iron-molybdenum cofactor biosynthesis protein [Armatimonadota bacterium]OIO94762.1 MAG: hypothetical protein AUJ96_28065 [Armatimonadetes bacterium CG2_30_66_41]PIU90497.1 MAG: dinitrogenase iron-molybdenum cofactor biosynthesis protein [Armatimonadetes bacterium CG06_land_8_20_14_3_00_66_21]PIW20691.1 MAG: dinitrogenase iron-molybdenum cofactor biosynthesis protein [Armatimonadetes bacterium CG17_big_fil_post_rev_8_21_14_2_50_66_6]PIX40975.1 MAG: dinitrogenase iron-molybdenum 
MKVAVSASGPSLEAMVDPRFGRAAYFVIVDPDSMAFEAIENPNVMAAGGAGIQSAQLVAGKGAEAVLTGNAGPNAFQALSAGGLTLYQCFGGMVRQAVEQFKAGALQIVGAPTVASHAGMGMRGGSAMAGGGSWGGGTGMGQGMGRGMSGAGRQCRQRGR